MVKGKTAFRNPSFLQPLKILNKSQYHNNFKKNKQYWENNNGNGKN